VCTIVTERAGGLRKDGSPTGARERSERLAKDGTGTGI
jgi:hypothetical protein